MADINSILSKSQDYLMSFPNVAGVGIGEKKGRAVIVIFVTRKIPESALQPHEIVPRNLEGYETDIREVGEVRAQPR